MRHLVFLYVGALAMVIGSYVGLVEIPDSQIRPLAAESTSEKPWGDVALGRAEYVSLGCIYCHSQQVRPEGFGSDIDRGWGERGTEAADYAFDEPPLLGTMRTGPDLASIGARQPSELWHYLHLYAPPSTSPGSTMPAFRFLFRLADEPLPNSIELPNGKHLVPSIRAQRLVAYLLSLKKAEIGALDE